MNSKIMFLLLALSITIATASALYDDDVVEDAYLEHLLTKRRGGKKGKWTVCPDNENCFCFVKGGEVLSRGSCKQSNSGNVGL